MAMWEAPPYVARTLLLLQFLLKMFLDTSASECQPNGLNCVSGAKELALKHPKATPNSPEMGAVFVMYTFAKKDVLQGKILMSFIYLFIYTYICCLCYIAYVILLICFKFIPISSASHA